MNKELTPLEALNDLIEGLEDEHYGLSESEWVVERKDIIETALKALEIIQQNAFLDKDGNIMPANRTKTQEEYDLLKEVLL